MHNRKSLWTKHKSQILSFDWLRLIFQDLRLIVTFKQRAHYLNTVMNMIWYIDENFVHIIDTLENKGVCVCMCVRAYLCVYNICLQIHYFEYFCCVCNFIRLHYSLNIVILLPSCVLHRPSCVNFYIFIFFSRTGGQISAKLRGDHPWEVGTQSCRCGACGPQGVQGLSPQVKKQHSLDFMYVRGREFHRD